jgi:single-stranded DNA-binding protein
LSKYARKGNLIGVSGTLTSRKYEDKDGNKRTTYEVQVDDVEILSSKGESTEAAETNVAGVNIPFEEVKTEEADLPF